MGNIASSPTVPDGVMVLLGNIRHSRDDQCSEDHASRLFVYFHVWADRIVEVAKEDPWYITEKTEKKETTELLRCVKVLQRKFDDTKIRKMLSDAASN